MPSVAYFALTTTGQQVPGTAGAGGAGAGARYAGQQRGQLQAVSPRTALQPTGCFPGKRRTRGSARAPAPSRAHSARGERLRRAPAGVAARPLPGLGQRRQRRPSPPRAAPKRGARPRRRSPRHRPRRPRCPQPGPLSPRRPHLHGGSVWYRGSAALPGRPRSTRGGGQRARGGAARTWRPPRGRTRRWERDGAALGDEGRPSCGAQGRGGE